MKNTIEEIHQYLIESLCLDFGFVLITEEIENWHSLTWTQFEEQMNLQDIDLSLSLNRNWRIFFNLEKEKYLLLKILSKRNSFINSKDLIAPSSYN